ncbi:(11Z)-hexadec-11-enoyl-CoA conjugase isoform X3 [Polyergus mexicanus]|uniref:(11Z)-hexadec-11-enoyl-CoA conjugase isoform X3 n=2 Tax=Polyergus mexicanus TaxID=615972 RepID=UPI0038B64974
MIDRFCMEKVMYSSTVVEYEDNKSRKLTQSDTEDGKNSILDQPPKENIPAEQPLIWRNIIGISALHVITIYLFVTRYNEAKFWTWIFEISYGILGALGVTAGAHRFWAHRSYSAKLPLKILLSYLYCMAGQTHLTKWIRVHRTHHRYTDTSADPHNSNRGFFFSHVGWLMMKHHPAVKEYGKNVNMSDIAADPVIRFFDKYYPPIMLSLCFVLPILIPVYIWNETWIISIAATITRYIFMLNAAFAVNSFAHLCGTRPYNRNLKATENLTVSIVTFGEGWHNYHHSFPWDYKAAELGLYRVNLTTAFIDFMAWIGLAYDLKTSSFEIIDSLCTKKGDGTASQNRTQSRYTAIK